MKEAEFDKVAAEYSVLHAANIVASGEDPSYFAEYKIRDVKAEYYGVQSPSSTPAILDFGCGIGSSIPFFRKYLPNCRVTGLDVSERSISIARDSFAHEGDFRIFDGFEIPFPDRTFDIAFAACVFHHIPQDDHVRLLAELRRVLKGGGMLILYEHNPFNPLTVRAVNTCPFDKNAHLVRARVMKARFVAASFAEVVVRYRVFIPKMLRVFRPLEKALKWLPIGAQYYVRGNRCPDKMTAVEPSR